MSPFFIALVILAAQPGEETSATVQAVPSMAAVMKPILAQRASRNIKGPGRRQFSGTRGRTGRSAARLTGQGNVQADTGQELAELIQKTISPAHWNVNGGPGSIYYWRPGRALVISASEEAHQQIGGTLDQLRRAGQ